MKLNIDIKKLQRNNKGSSWQKAVLLSLMVGTALITASYLYLIIKPLPTGVKALIDEEISAVDINFDQKTIDSIKERQLPADIKQSISGKNPFAGF